MSAAAQITIFLLFIVLAPILTVSAGLVGWLYWRERQERRRLERTVQQAEIYGQLSSLPIPRPRLRSHRQPAQPAAGGNVFIVSGGEQRPADSGGWRVLQ